MPDIDIDFADRQDLLSLIDYTAARLETTQGVKHHNSGVYVTDIPYDPEYKCSSINYTDADKRGYFKSDFLNVGVYKLIQDNEHYTKMIETPAPWERLWTDPLWVANLVHVGNYADLLREMQPDSIPRMAAFISIIRPGKAHLQKQPWDVVFDTVWDGDDSKGFIFKKSHAISYAFLVALHMNLLNTPD